MRFSPTSLLTVGRIWHCYGSVEGQELKGYTLTNFLVNIMKQRTNNCKTNKTKVTHKTLKQLSYVTSRPCRLPRLRIKTIICSHIVVIVINITSSGFLPKCTNTEFEQDLLLQSVVAWLLLTARMLKTSLPRVFNNSYFRVFFISDHPPMFKQNHLLVNHTHDS